MKEVIIILGVVLLSGTDAWAANLQTRDEAMQSREAFSLSSYISEQVTTNQADGCNNTLSQERESKLVILRGKVQLIEAGFADPSRGNPDGRGKDSKGGSTR
jgi:hypothetical protein